MDLNDCISVKCCCNCTKHCVEVVITPALGLKGAGIPTVGRVFINDTNFCITLVYESKNLSPNITDSVASLFPKVINFASTDN